MTTSKLVFSYSREVYALPGRVDDPCSQGCNLLIRNKIAEPITSTDTLLESLRLDRTCRKHKISYEDVIRNAYNESQSSETVDRLCRIIRIIKEERGISLDEITSATGYDPGTVLHIAGLLETDGFINIDILQRCCIEIGKFR